MMKNTCEDIPAKIELKQIEQKTLKVQILNTLFVASLQRFRKIFQKIKYTNLCMIALLLIALCYTISMSPQNIFRQLITGKISISDAAKILGWPPQLVAAAVKSPLVQPAKPVLKS